MAQLGGRRLARVGGLACARDRPPGALVERGCLLCPNGDSAFGDNGPVAEQAFWQLVDEGLVALVASDGHSSHRPPRLDQAHRLLVERYGEAATEGLFDGSAIPWIHSLSGIAGAFGFAEPGGTTSRIVRTA